MIKKIPVIELNYRMEKFKSEMNNSNPDWELAVIFSKINIYYFTGTMQDGILIIPRDNESILWVRRSYERALNESLFKNIKSMKSFRDPAKNMHYFPETVHIEAEVIPLALYRRFQKHFPIKNYKIWIVQLPRLDPLKVNMNYH